MWGFDYEAVDVLQEMKPKEEDIQSHRFAILLNNNISTDTNQQPQQVHSVHNFLFYGFPYPPEMFYFKALIIAIQGVRVT